MKLKVLGSNSQGNCYILDGADEALVIECGIPDFRDLLRAVEPRRIAAAAITHQHNDHARHIATLVEHGITTLALPEAFRTHGIPEGAPFAREIAPGRAYRTGGFTVQPFPVDHDVPCVGFIIGHREMGRLLFVTDTMDCPYTFSGLTQVMIEANYSDAVLDRRIEMARGRALQHLTAMRPRLYRSHMELGTTKAILQSLDLSRVDSITLIHLSDENSDEAAFVREITRATGKLVRAADKGMEVEL